MASAVRRRTFCRCSRGYLGAGAVAEMLAQPQCAEDAERSSRRPRAAFRQGALRAGGQGCSRRGELDARPRPLRPTCDGGKLTQPRPLPPTRGGGNVARPRPPRPLRRRRNTARPRLLPPTRGGGSVTRAKPPPSTRGDVNDARSAPLRRASALRLPARALQLTARALQASHETGMAVAASPPVSTRLRRRRKFPPFATSMSFWKLWSQRPARIATSGGFERRCRFQRGRRRRKCLGSW